MTTLILGGLDDEHAVFMRDYLLARRADVELLDSRWFPQQLGLSFDPAADQWTIRLPEGRVLKGSQIRSVYWRCYNGVEVPSLPDGEQTFIAENDSRGLFESFLIGLPVLWVNGWNAFKLHQTKPVQLAIAAKLGATIPATMLTNDGQAVREFVAQQPRSIFKPIQGGAHTRPVTSTHLTDENLRSLAIAPVTLQEEIPGTNIRVFVAGQRVLACEVRTETLDFRDTADPVILKHDLPDDIAELCLRIAGAMGLVWTGVDLRLTPDGRYVFLEANPSPMFLGFQSRCQLPIAEALAELLTQGNRMS